MKFAAVLALLAPAAAMSLTLKTTDDVDVPTLPAVGPASYADFSEVPDAAQKIDGAYADKAEACAACKYSATRSCTYYLTAKCYAANTVALDFSDMTPQDADAVDKDGVPLGQAKSRGDTSDWKWTMNAENAGANYELCYPSTGEQGVDNFGDKYDPNDAEGAWKKCMDQVTA